MHKLRSRLTYANVTATLALAIAVAGGTAYAADTVFSTDIVDGEVKSADIGNSQVRSADVRSQTLTGDDIADQSGVDTCIATLRIGDLCVRAENFARPFHDALLHCANLGLRVPSVSEGLELAKTHDIPNVDEDEHFWTDTPLTIGDTFSAYTINDAGQFGFADFASQRETVCVMTPTN